MPNLDEIYPVVRESKSKNVDIGQTERHPRKHDLNDRLSNFTHLSVI